MIFPSLSVERIFIGGAFAWICALTVYIVRLARHYHRLTQGITTKGLGEILERILSAEQDNKRRIVDINNLLQIFDKDGKLHIQRFGIVRFNPFHDTGGAQSFTLALLDGYDNGLVMTSLYARSGNRWYVKELKEGKGIELALSKEEESAVKRAQHIGAHIS